MTRLHLCFLIVGLLASCDKSSDTGKPRSSEESNPRLTRANRAAREDAADRNEDLRESLKAALEIESPGAREQALAEVVRNAFERAPEIAAEALGQLPADSEERTKTIRYLASFLAQKNPDEALAWAASWAPNRKS